MSSHKYRMPGFSRAVYLYQAQDELVQILGLRSICDFPR